MGIKLVVLFLETILILVVFVVQCVVNIFPGVFNLSRGQRRVISLFLLTKWSNAVELVVCGSSLEHSAWLSDLNHYYRLEWNEYQFLQWGMIFGSLFPFKYSMCKWFQNFILPHNPQRPSLFKALDDQKCIRGVEWNRNITFYTRCMMKALIHILQTMSMRRHLIYEIQLIKENNRRKEAFNREKCQQARFVSAIACLEPFCSVLAFKRYLFHSVIIYNGS